MTYRPDSIYDLVGNFQQKMTSQQNNLKNYVRDALREAYKRGYEDANNQNKAFEEGLRVGYQNRCDEEHESIRTMIDMSLQKCEDSTAENVSESDDSKE